ncbi:small integral membrane protein 4 [Episyrphus balteatus]|uniref:small integral membrane protein 4 n=1 Tax=Episyrphus balteatus TaxID=286459 RepID=UPI002486794A|nr:small integral membrane protein 4 [Episyrphus balteatus]XP_055843775.1 small integral membrane protein 4 [Episyrphus balteatus]
MHWYSASLRNFLDKWPGKKSLGIYRFLPLFFVLGAALEFSMINWTVGETNFYRTYKKRQAKNLIESKLAASITEAKTTA